MRTIFASRTLYAPKRRFYGVLTVDVGDSDLLWIKKLAMVKD
jgi:hypothetical protein